MQTIRVVTILLAGAGVGAALTWLLSRWSFARRVRKKMGSFEEAELALKKNANELKESSMLYSSALNAFYEGIVIADSHSTVLYANAAFLSIFSLKGNIVGKKISDITGYPILESVYESCRSEGGSAQKETVVYGDVAKQLSIRSSPFFTGDSRGILIVVDDITALKRLENVRRDFVANVSHELRTPIQLVRGFSELISSSPEDEAGVRKYAAIIEHNSFRMEKIVSDLLTLAQLENDPGSWLVVEPCQLSDLLSSAASAIAPKAEEKRMPLEVDCPPDLVVNVNPGLIEQAIVNLLENAYRYSPENTRVKIAAEDDGQTVRISVKDQGPGISPKDLEHIFERFYRVDKSRNKQTGGTGLGLAIVKHIASAHGGSVEVSSWAGEGSTFTLLIPKNNLGKKDMVRVRS